MRIGESRDLSFLGRSWFGAEVRCKPNVRCTNLKNYLPAKNSIPADFLFGPELSASIEELSAEVAVEDVFVTYML